MNARMCVCRSTSSSCGTRCSLWLSSLALESWSKLTGSTRTTDWTLSSRHTAHTNHFPWDMYWSSSVSGPFATYVFSNLYHLFLVWRLFRYQYSVHNFLLKPDAFWCWLKLYSSAVNCVASERNKNRPNNNNNTNNNNAPLKSQEAWKLDQNIWKYCKCNTYEWKIISKTAILISNLMTI